MDTQLKEQLIAIINSAREMGADLSSFVQAQAPELAKEIVAYQFWDSFVFSICLILGIVLVLYCIKKICQFSEEAGMVVAAFGGMFAICMACGLVYNVRMMVKAKVAPRIVVMEFITDTVKGQR